MPKKPTAKNKEEKKTEEEKKRKEEGGRTEKEKRKKENVPEKTAIWTGEEAGKAFHQEKAAHPVRNMGGAEEASDL